MTPHIILFPLATHIHESNTVSFSIFFQLFYFSCLGYPWFKTRHLFFKAWKFIYDHFGSVEENEGKGKTREVKEFWNLCSDDSDDTNKNVMAMLVDKGASDSVNDSSSSGNSVGGGDGCSGIVNGGCWSTSVRSNFTSDKNEKVEYRINENKTYKP